MTWPLGGFDAYHASPPCQARGRATKYRNRYPELIKATRGRLQLVGAPYVIENVPPVPGAEPLRPDLIVCGCMVGLPTELVRERHFETWPVLFDLRQPCYHTAPAISVTQRCGRDNGPGERRNKYVSLGRCCELMGIDWMQQAELGEAIPPAYTEYVGGLLLEHLAGLTC